MPSKNGGALTSIRRRYTALHVAADRSCEFADSSDRRTIPLFTFAVTCRGSNRTNRPWRAVHVPLTTRPEGNLFALRESLLVPTEHPQRPQRVPFARTTIAVLEREVDRSGMGVFEQPGPIRLLLRPKQVNRSVHARVRRIAC